MLNTYADIRKAIDRGDCFTSYFTKNTPAVIATAGRWYSLLKTGGTFQGQTYNNANDGYPFSAVSGANNGQYQYGFNTDQMSGPPTGIRVGPHIVNSNNYKQKNKRLVAASAYSNVATVAPGMLMIVDILFYAPTFVLNGLEQVIIHSFEATNPAELDFDMLRNYSAQIYFEVTTALSAATGVLSHTIRYTEDGETGYDDHYTSSTLQASSPVMSIPYLGGPFIPLGLGKSPHRTNRSINWRSYIPWVSSCMRSSGTVTGTLAYFVVQPICTIPIRTAGLPVEKNIMMTHAPYIREKANLSLLYFAGGATPASTPISGELTFAWG